MRAISIRWPSSTLCGATLRIVRSTRRLGEPPLRPTSPQRALEDGPIQCRDEARAEGRRQRAMRGARADESRPRPVDVVCPREGEDQSRQRRPAPARRRAAGMRAQRRLDDTRHVRDDTFDFRCERIRTAVGKPVEHEVKSIARCGPAALPHCRCGDEYAFAPFARRRAGELSAVPRPRTPRRPMAARARGQRASATSVRVRPARASLAHAARRGRELPEPVEQPRREVHLRLCERGVEPDAADGSSVASGGVEDIAA